MGGSRPVALGGCIITEPVPVRQLRWMVQELRVNVFAQVLGTPYPVSEQRIYRAMDAVADQ